MTRATWSVVPLLLLTLARDAGAQTPAPASPRVFFPPPRVVVFTSLAYERQRGAEVCPDESTLRAELGRRLGHDPFKPNPQGISVGDVRIVLTKIPGGFAARYDWTGPSDVPQPRNRFEGPGRTQRDCHDVLVDVAMELGIYFSVLAMEYGKKHAPKRSAPAAPACPATETAAPAPCGESRFSVWPPE